MQIFRQAAGSWALLVICLFTTAMTCVGQEPILKKYEWEEKPVLHQLDPAEQSEPEITLKDKRTIEFFYDDARQLHEYNLKHTIIKVNSDKAIQVNNRIYIPFSNDVTVVQQRARVINSEGKVKELKKEDIKEARDEETNQTYRYFAVEGVDIGSEIEYYYLLDKYPAYTGSLITLQSQEIVRNVSVEIISPKSLVFATKSYNGLPDMTYDTNYKELNYLKMEVEKIPALKREESATYAPHLQQLIYKLDKDHYSGKKQVISYDEAAKALYQTIYGESTKKTDKKLEQLINSQKFDQVTDPEEQIRKVENYVKSTFTIVDFNAEEYGKLEDVLDKKICSESGVTKLFANIFKKMNIPHRIVLTSDRDRLRFDPEFEAYNFLQNYVIYFPELDKYLAPSMTFLRLGFIPPGWTYNYGLFLEPFSMGDYETALPKVKFIKTPDYEESMDNLVVNVEMGKDLDQLKLKIKRSSTGYYAQNTQPFYDFLNEEQKKEVTESVVKNISPDADIQTISYENEGGSWFGVKPFVVTSDLTSGAFMEKAGPKYLFKVGELIGPQIEMYQEEKRVLEVENDFARKYHRIIEFNIPEGYEIKNIDNLAMNVAYEADGDTLMAFVSVYSREENRVTVDIVEYYKKIIYPLSLFEEYRKVINAAADFNKVALILEKKKA